MRLGRWRLAAFGLALYGVCVSYWHWRGESHPDAEARVAHSSDARAHRAIASRLRGALRDRGAVEEDLLYELERAQTPRRFEAIASQLGWIGGDLSVRALVPHISDSRFGTSAVEALGQIGTDGAIDALVDTVERGQPWVARRAIVALASSGSQRASDLVMEWALEMGNPFQGDAIEVLGDAVGPDALVVFRQVAATADASVISQVIQAAAALGTAEGDDFVLGLSHSHNREVRVAALAAMASSKTLSAEELLARTGDLDPDTAAAAIRSYAQAAGPEGLGRLAELSRSGVSEVRSAAIEGLVEIGSEAAHKELEKLLHGGNFPALEAAASALTGAGDAASIALVARAARARPGIERTLLLRHLQGARGPEVEQMFLEAAAGGTRAERVAALNHFYAVNNTQAAFDLATSMVGRGGSETQEALWLLGRLPGERATGTLLELAQQNSQIGWQALSMLAENRASDPAVTQLLIERMQSGRQHEAREAAAALARSGSESGRGLILQALNAEDADAAAAAVASAMHLGLDDEVRSGLVAVVERDLPAAVKIEAMNQLFQAGTAEGDQLVREALLGDSTELANAAIEALSSRQDAESVSLLVETAQEGASEELRASAVRALGSYGSDPSAHFDLLMSLAGDSDEQVRGAALESLASSDAPEAVEFVTQHVRGRDGGDEQLVDLLVYSEQPAAERELVRIIGGADKEAAQHAIERLPRGSDLLDEAVLAALYSDVEGVARAAAYHLRSIGVRTSDRDRTRIAALIGDE